MAITTVLSILKSNRYEQDLKSAASFCATYGAHLTALAVSIGAAPSLSQYDAISTIWLDERQREIDELATTAAKIKEVLADSDLSFEVQDLYTEFAWADEDIAQRALYADVVLLGSDAAEDADLRKRIFDGALFQAPTPILINRGQQAITTSPRAVVLAWDSSNEAARAARQSLDLLERAEIVHVTMVDPVARMRTNGEEPGADIAAFLTRHGVKVQVDRLSSEGRNADAIITRHAVDMGADLIVMGAYNHPRWQQSLFGGVTRRMIEDCQLPLFLAH
ncbi:universal stress protein [Rhizobium sp. CF142]|jgi:nucleotide-binding universal stress UspA family protein|uniref:universal stress protein n=1 Tax=Rhizobium sp. CF142 TaxID=1144314 RepID=UPI00026EF692|nr:universal stress protein [Rhizobium sp. CF142]EJJ27689.1 universal stress protein UspA-like protein [Rhizobium sp. CF142]